MKILNMQSTNTFGKYPVMSCLVKEKETGKYVSSTVYQLDYNNPTDVDEVRYSKNTNAIKTSFLRARDFDDTYMNYYFAKNDKTGEVISCSSTTHRFSPMPQEGGFYTNVEEFSQNEKYENASLPMLAYITGKASGSDSFVKLAFRPVDKQPFTNAGFVSNDMGQMVLPADSFNNLLDKSSSENCIEFLV